MDIALKHMAYGFVSTPHPTPPYHDLRVSKVGIKVDVVTINLLIVDRNHRLFVGPEK